MKILKMKHIGNSIGVRIDIFSSGNIRGGNSFNFNVMLISSSYIHRFKVNSRELLSIPGQVLIGTQCE